ncbi:hypothetical protein BUALT_Bualt09G0084700 [Buddleja alternifolia]|uniref:Uncharacterized protein n=1 Tax=Buddleja alternifolia TaxID=168488 RepID=A0AAV6X884_9LAMI|nr:hypothetical protein BUALT_Bualt09G0084700 [Buddleja alternifolia]
MENSSSKMEVIKPVFIKAGIPLAITLAGCVFAKIAARKSSLPESRVDSQEIDTFEVNGDEDRSFHSLDSETVPCAEADYTEDYYHKNTIESSVTKRDEVLGLRSRIEEIQDREWQLEKRFLRYQELKDQEMVLMELHNKFLVETNRVEFLGREISLLEAENRRFENVAMEVLKVLRMLEVSRSENEKLRVRVKKLSGRTQEQFRVLRKQSLKIGFQEKEISKNQKEVEVKDDCIRLMEDEIMKLKIIIEILQEDKTELSDKLRVAEESAASKVDEETVSVEKYNELACQVERMKKDEAGQVRELIHLRWCNACLRHELMRRNQEQERMEENNEVEINYGGNGEIEEYGSDNELNRCNQIRVHSRRRRLIAKFKRWVEGSEKCKHNLEEETEDHGNKCFRRQRSVSDEAEEACVLARKSCSSA